MTMRRIATLVFLAFPWAVVQPAPALNKHYPVNRPPMDPGAFVALPLGAVKPAGWLEDQLTIQANGLTGYLDEFWPSVAYNSWRGGDAWERPPYYLDGLVPLAYLLEDPRLIAKVESWLGWIVTSTQRNGWFGPTHNNDRWPLAIALKVLTQYHEATGDERALKTIQEYFRYLKENPAVWPSDTWTGARAMETVLSIRWLYRRTGDPGLLEIAEYIQNNSRPWTDYFLKFPYTDEVMARGGIKYDHGTHVVNIAMATKYPGLWYLFSKEPRYRQAVVEGIASLHRYHGQTTGRFSGDEHLSGRRPTQGTELCAVVEYMFSLENLVEMFGEVPYADRLEELAYNANPGACTADYWAHQYDQQANQVLVSVARRAWSTNGDTANIYGLEPHFGCCTANMHQGWPKFVSHMWMATHDQGLAAVAYGPNRVTAKVGDHGETVTIEQRTDYPFNGNIRLTIQADTPTAFPLYLRIPAWAQGAAYTVGGQTTAADAGTFAIIRRTWQPGDIVELNLPMRLRTTRRYNDAISIERGPLFFSLKIGEKWTKLKSYHPTLPTADWQIEPTTPWNYALALDPARPDDGLLVEMRPIGKVPFDTAAAPVIIRARGRQVPEWKLEQNSAGETPKSPVHSEQPLEDLELIPYGSTRLRISEFPVLAR